MKSVIWPLDLIWIRWALSWSHVPCNRFSYEFWMHIFTTMMGRTSCMYAVHDFELSISRIMMGNEVSKLFVVKKGLGQGDILLCVYPFLNHRNRLFRNLMGCQCFNEDGTWSTAFSKSINIAWRSFLTTRNSIVVGIALTLAIWLYRRQSFIL